MARPLRIQYPGAFYHVTARGNEQKDIFKSRRDREKFLSYLSSASSRYGAVVHCYCLMSNHYHLLLETPEGNLSQIMRHINGAYTTYFNIKRKRSGHLLQGRYKAILVEADEYALDLSRYIHLNPVKVGLVECPEQYDWSSYKAYIHSQTTTDWFRCDLILGMSGRSRSKARKNYRTFVENSLERIIENPLKNVVASSLLGSPDFVREITDCFLGDQTDSRNFPDLKHLQARPDIEQVVSVVERHLSNHPTRIRQVGMYCCRQFTRSGLKQIGQHFGISDAGVSVAAKRVAECMKADAQLREVIRKIESEVELLNVEI